jgi:hypothetical protein
MDIDAAALRIHQTAKDHGFWDKERNLGEMLMLVTSELAECLEENRAGKPRVYWKCKDCGYETVDQPDSMGHKPDTMAAWCAGDMKPEGELVEVADAIIRLLDTGHDMASKTRYTLSDVMAFKMIYNDDREHMHGKAY